MMGRALGQTTLYTMAQRLSMSRSESSQRRKRQNRRVENTEEKSCEGQRHEEIKRQTEKEGRNREPYDESDAGLNIKREIMKEREKDKIRRKSEKEKEWEKRK